MPNEMMRIEISIEKDLDYMVLLVFLLLRRLSRLNLPIERVLVSQWYALTHTQRPSTMITRRNNNNNIINEKIATNRVIRKLAQPKRTR